MNPSPAKKEIHLQGQRPTPLKVTKDSHKIQKPPIPPKSRAPHVPPHHLTGNHHHHHHPMVIYSVSPKPIHADPCNFMSIVQRLTGNQPSSPEIFPFSGEAPVSPAARMAAMEKASPTAREAREERVGGVGDEVLVERDGVMVGGIPGILSPAPANLPAIGDGLFSPAAIGVDGFGFGFGESDWMMSPFMNSISSGLLVSPSTLFLSGGSAAIVSPPTLSPATIGDLFGIFDF